MHVGNSGVYPCKPQTIASYVTAQTPTYNIIQRCVSLYMHPQSQVDMKPLICSTADTSKDVVTKFVHSQRKKNIASPFNTFHHIQGQDNCPPCMYVIAYECMCVFRASRRRAGHSPPLNPCAPLSKCPQSITYGNSYALLTWTIASS